MSRSSDSRITRTRRRWLSPTPAVAVDLFRHALARHSWLPLFLIICAAGAALVLVLGQTVVPWVIYPAL